MSFTSADLRRANLLAMPSTQLQAGAVYLLAFRAAGEPDPAKVAPQIAALSIPAAGALPDLRAVGGVGGQVGIPGGFGQAIQVRGAGSDGKAGPSTSSAGTLLERIRSFDAGLHLTIAGLGIGPAIGGGAHLELEAAVAADAPGLSGSLADKLGQLLAATKDSGALRSPVTKALDTVTHTVGGTVGDVFDTLKLILVLAIVAGAVYLYLQARKG